jgi:nitrous oxide reductase accessory protein NosL
MPLKSLAPFALVAATIIAAGCSQSAETAPAVAETHHAADGHSHDGWWCDEHGVPEEVCALCDSKIAADFQRKGDWCKAHDRPDSQCFTCHPELAARFAAQYEAKYGEKPPKPEG